MTFRTVTTSLALTVSLGLASLANAQETTTKVDGSDAPAGKSAPAPKLEKATFGGGCFWCTEAVFERVPGVKSVVSGYAGGFVANPSYEQVCTGMTGHAEVIQVVFDPKVVTFDTLLKVFFTAHDPTTLNEQGPDSGTQYRSIILYHDDVQKAAAQKMYQKLTASRAYRDPIVTELVPLTVFFPAEAYHQDYFKNHRGDDYCRINIPPKLRKLQKLHLEEAKPAEKK